MTSLLSTLCSRAATATLARSLLHTDAKTQTEDAKQQQQRSLPLLLLLLDCLSTLAALQGQQLVGLGLQATSSSDGESRAVNANEQETAAAEILDAWTNYARELYGSSDADGIWSAPLAVDETFIPINSAASYSTETIRQTARKAYGELQARMKALHSESSGMEAATVGGVASSDDYYHTDTVAELLQTSNSFARFDLAFYQVVADSLSDARSAASESTLGGPDSSTRAGASSPNLFLARSLLTGLLEHHLGVAPAIKRKSHPGSLKTPSSESFFAGSPEDTAAVEAYYASCNGFRSLSSQSLQTSDRKGATESHGYDEDDSLAAEESPETLRVRKQTLAQLKSDDKLRWLVGADREARKSAFFRPTGSQASDGPAPQPFSPSHRQTHSDSDLLNNTYSGSDSPADELNDMIFIDSNMPMTRLRRAASDASSLTTASGLYSQHRTISTATSMATITRTTQSDVEQSSSLRHSMRSQPSINSLTGLLDSQGKKRPASLQRAFPAANIMTSVPIPASFTSFASSISDLPVHDIADHDAPLIKTLSADERRNLIRRGKKLQAVLGATLGQVEASLNTVGRGRYPSDPSPSPGLLAEEYYSGEGSGSRPSSLRHSASRRRMSYPPASPTSSLHSAPSSPKSTRMRQSASGSYAGDVFSPATVYSSTSFARSSSGGLGGLSPDDSVTSPELGERSPQTPLTYNASRPWGLTPDAPLDPRTKEERRRRVAKVYALLGEHIPVAQIVDTNDAEPVEELSASSESSPASLRQYPKQPRHNRSGSRFAQAGGLITKGIKSLRGKSRSDTVSSSSEDETEAPLPSLRFPSAPPTNSVRDLQYACLCYKADIFQPLTSEVTIDTIRRYRKLEMLLGELPPANLRRNPITSTPVTSDDDAELLLRRRMSLTALQTISPDELAAELSAIYEERPGTALTDVSMLSNPLILPNSLSSNVDSVLSGAPSSFGSAFLADGITPSPADSDNKLELAQEESMRRSMDGKRALARAARLANFFGTTKGEVLAAFLKDIETDLADDSTATEEDRELYQRAVHRLRGSFSA